MGANPAATVKAFNEAENYNGPAIIIAYAHCIEQGLLTKTGPVHQKAAVDSVHFPLWRYNPAAEGKKITLDSADKSATVSFAANAVSKELGENRAAPCGHFAIACALARYAVCAASLRCSASRLIFGASQAARQEGRRREGDDHAQGRRGRLQGELRSPQEALRDVRLG